MTFITRKSIPRRTFLRGTGAVIALPVLDAMVPALAAQQFKATPRLGFVYVSNGVILEQWKPAKIGAGFELPPILKPLAPVHEYVNVLTGLAHLQADTMGDGTGDHPRASAVWLTGVHAYDRTRPGVEVKLATTADQIAAHAIGKNTRLPSVELTVDSSGNCDSGDCFYVNTVSWRNETTPNLAESHPRVVFERMFGDGGTPEQRAARNKSTGSILDSITEETTSLVSSLGRGDRRKLSEYLDSVREIEQRIQGVEHDQQRSLELPDRPIDVPADFDQHTRLMFDLQLLAFRADVTRVFSMVMARELSGRTFPHIGVPDAHHAISHHRNDSELIAKKSRIDTYHVQLLTYFLEKMKATPDGDGSLLDHSLIMYGGGMGDGNLHRHFDLPCLLAGKLCGRMKTGLHHAYPANTPMSNLLLTLLDKVDVRLEKFGDSTGRLDPDYLSI